MTIELPMPSPSVDIIVPVWNNPFETRACLAAILEYSPEARLIVIDNGSSRETELMLEEFSESLGERGLFMTTERNLGLVPAINRALASSDADFAVIVRPRITVYRDWLKLLLDAAVMPGVGLVSPTFKGSQAPAVDAPIAGCSLAETFSLSFASLLLRGEMHRQLGGFDEELDGALWCLRDYIRRAQSIGYHTCVSMLPKLDCGPETVFGSEERRREQLRISRERYLDRWGLARHYCLYFGPDVDAAELTDTVEALVAAARRGDRFILLLHRRQFKEFRQRGWNGLHTAIEVRKLPLLRTQRSLTRQLTELQVAHPELIPVRGSEAVEFPGTAAALSITDVTARCSEGTTLPGHRDNAMEAA